MDAISHPQNQQPVNQSAKHQLVSPNGPLISPETMDDKLMAELQHLNGKVYQLIDVVFRNITQGHSISNRYDYRFENSLIAFWESKPTIVLNDDGVPIHKLWYMFLFTFVTDDNDNVIHHKDHFEDFYKLKFNPAIAVYQPSQMEMVDCHGFKLGRSGIDLHATFETGCQHCCGCRDLRAYDLFHMLHKEVPFANIMKTNIIGYLKMYKPIVMMDEKILDQELAVVAQDQQTIADIMAIYKPGGSYERELQVFTDKYDDEKLMTFIGKLSRQKQADQQKVIELNIKHGGNIDGVQQQLITKKQEMIDVRAAMEQFHQQRQHQQNSLNQRESNNVSGGNV